MDLSTIRQHPKATILKYAIPSIIAMAMTSLVTIVDGLFVSNYVGKMALSGIHLGLPILYLFLGIAIMIGVGGVSIAGRLLGQREPEKSIQIFNQTLATGACFMLVLVIITRLLLPPILQLFRLDPALVAHMQVYYKIILLVYPFMMMNIICGMFIRAEGNPQFFMVVTLFVNIINIALDYYFIGLKGMGLVGAATASGISIFIGFLGMQVFFLRFSKVFHFTKFSFSIAVFRETLYNGSSELIGQLSISVTNFLFNAVVLSQIGINGIAALTLVGYSGYMYNMVIIGFGQGTSPIISYCYGAMEKELCFDVRDKTIQLVSLVAIVFYGVLAIFAPLYSTLFSKDILVSQYIVVGLRIYALSFIPVGYNTLSSFFFTATGFPMESAVISAARGLIILSVAIFVLPTFWGIIGVWCVAPVTECLTAFIAYKYTHRERRLAFQ